MNVIDPNSFSQKLKEFYWTVTRALGLSALHDRRVVYAFTIRVFGWVFFPVYFVLVQLLKRTRIRFIQAQFNGEPYGIIEHIGHCAMDFDTYLKQQILLNRRVTPIFLCAGRKPANATLLDHWSRYIHFVYSPFLEWLLRPLMRFPELVDSTEGYTTVRHGAAALYDVQGRWGARGPLLHLSEVEIARGEAELRKLGIPEDSWFVCVHSREGGYIPGSEWQHSFRNSNIADYREAMRAIVEKGGWCIRVGDPTMHPLEPIPGVIDYALSPSKSDWMDLFLCARCRFFIGNTSGLFGLASIFGRPSALANLTPLVCAYSPFSGDISIVKILLKGKDHIINFSDAFSSEASNFRYTSEFAEQNLNQLDNSPEEIAELVTEMMDQLDGSIVYEPSDIELQDKFRALIQPHHYCWPPYSHIGRGFLRRHRALLSSGTSKPDEEKSERAN